MDFLEKINELCLDIEKREELLTEEGWVRILDVLKENMAKDPTAQYISINSAVKIYLGFSNDYENVIFGRLCAIDSQIKAFYENKVRGFIKNNSSLSDKRIDKMLKKLRIHKDLYSEIIEFILNDNKYVNNLIEVQGYTAQDLYTKYNLSVVGAYNFLIYLREDPKNALADLKAGLPRK